MAFTVTTSTLGGNTARLVTGTGNLSDLASALSTHGVTISERVITFAGTGANTYYAIDGTLTETRDGVWTVLVSTQSFVCWARDAAAVTTLGAISSSGSRTSRVDIRYLAGSFAIGSDPSTGFKPYACFVGNGTATFKAGSVSYECSTRSDLDIYSSAAGCTFDAFEVQLTSTGASYSHILTSANVVTTEKCRFSFMDTSKNVEARAVISTVNPFSANTGLTHLGLSSGVLTVLKPQYTNVHLSGASAGTVKVYDSTLDYVDAILGGTVSLEIYRTVYATFTDQLGVNITSPAPNLVSLLSGGSPASTAFSAGAASAAFRQSVAPGRAYTTGIGYTDDSTYTFYAVGFGYAAQYNTVNVKTAHAGNAGITWRANAVKSSLVTTAYASVVTAGFAFTTGTSTLDITTSRTTNQSAEYLFKLAYDTPTDAYWRGLLHVPATLNASGYIDFGAQNITVTGVTLSGTAFSTSGTVTLATGALCSANIIKSAGVFSSGALGNMTGTVTLTGSARWDITTGGTAASGSAAAGNTIRVTTASGGANFDFQAFVFNAATTFENTSGSAITLILGAGQTAPTLLPTSGSITISAPLVFQSITVTGFTAGSRIQIYDYSTAAPVGSRELFNGTATGGNAVITGSTCVWTDPLAAVATRDIRVRVAYVSGATAKEFIEANIGTCGTTAPSNAISYLVSQTNDTTYNANGVNGPSIYATSGITFTDAATDLVNCNISGGTVAWKTIYACFVYWNFTSTGISNDFTYVAAPDVGNYILTSMKLKNTSSGPVVPLTVTDGFGRDNTGSSANIVDTTGGSIFLVPEHVVAFETLGSPVITGDMTTILTAIPSAATNASAVLSAAATAPIQADIRKVNNITVTGSGTTIDPWGAA